MTDLEFLDECERLAATGRVVVMTTKEVDTMERLVAQISMAFGWQQGNAWLIKSEALLEHVGLARQRITKNVTAGLTK